MSLALEHMGTPLYDEAVRWAEEFSEDFQTQEDFVEGLLRACEVAA